LRGAMLGSRGPGFPLLLVPWTCLPVFPRQLATVSALLEHAATAGEQAAEQARRRRAFGQPH
jgi:hypothetical protein